MGADGLGEWEPFDVATVAQLMATTGAQWWLSGGQALDRFVGHTTRAHGDIDVSIRRDHLATVAARLASPLELKIARDAELSDLDVATADESVHGLWCRLAEGGPWRLQINLEPCTGGDWIYRRDGRVRRALAEVIEDRGGVPCVNPAVQLLWKARDRAPKDEADFATVVPLLPPVERAWLRGAIAIAHPDSPWRDAPGLRP